MQDIAIAIALLLVIEGLMYALFPSAMKQMMLKVQDLPENSLRIGGLVALGAGVFAVWLVRSI